MSRKSANRRQPRRGQTSSVRNKGEGRYWPDAVTRQSNALDLEPAVFTWSDPAKIARSLRQSAEASQRRRGTPYQSAMSMLNFFINRAGKRLPGQQKRILERTKRELRKLFGRE